MNSPFRRAYLTRRLMAPANTVPNRSPESGRTECHSALFKLSIHVSAALRKQEVVARIKGFKLFLFFVSSLQVRLHENTVLVTTEEADFIPFVFRNVLNLLLLLYLKFS